MGQGEMTPVLAVSLSFALSALAALALAPAMIRLLGRLRARQTVLGYVVQHEHKTGTPTMGGGIFLLPAAAAAAAFATEFSLICAALFLGYALLGFLDDFIKIRFSRNLGLRPYQKIAGQLGLAAIAGWFCYATEYGGGMLRLPFAEAADIGAWGIPLTVLLFVACSNSVNLTDGLDGLAASTSAGYFVVFAVLLVLAAADAAEAGTSAYGDQLLSLAGVSAALAGGLAGYLVSNANPAKVMMGDTGSLALGGAAAAVAAMSGYTLLVPLVGIMFVWSSISVIVQVTAFKVTARRVFLMSPFHHHLEMKGWSEARICALYTVLTLIGGAVALIFARA